MGRTIWNSSGSYVTSRREKNSQQAFTSIQHHTNKQLCAMKQAREYKGNVNVSKRCMAECCQYISIKQSCQTEAISRISKTQPARHRHKSSDIQMTALQRGIQNVDCYMRCSTYTSSQHAWHDKSARCNLCPSMQDQNKQETSHQHNEINKLWI